MRNTRLLSELRTVCGEVGSLGEAWALPTEVRAWWISEMNREREPAPDTGLSQDGRRIIRSVDVPRARRE